MRPFALITLALAASTCIADRLDDYVRQYMSARKIPAVVFGVFKDGKVVKGRAYGYADVERGVKATTDTIFEIGSVSKQFTATALLMLMEEGKLSLEDRIDRYVADLPEPWRPVTLRQLMNHTSGIPDMEEIFGYDSYRNIYTTAQLIAVANSKPMDFAPGADFHYSNTGYFLLGLALEKISGKTYSDFLKERIFIPLGMKNTRESDPTAIIPYRAAGYQVAKDGTLSNRDAMQPSACKGAGTLVSNIADMALWDAAISRHRLLKPATQALMWTESKTDKGTVPYGLGWFIAPWRGRPSVEHSGGTAGFSCDYRRFHDSGYSVMVFTNLYATGVGPIEMRALDLVAPGHSYASWPAKRETIPGRRAMFLTAMADIARGGASSPYFTAKMWSSYPQVSRDAWKQRLAKMKRFELIDHQTHAPQKTNLGDEVVETCIYRLVFGKDEIFVTFMLTKSGQIGSQTRSDT